ncbi:MAG: cytochrome c nitrite reductase small subunit [Deinococcaceae bacterium]
MRPNIVVAITLALLGLVIGLGLFTFQHAKGWSYFSSDPKACVNCHVMKPQYESWQHSSHRNIAACNDCHMPHNFFGKYYAKALNGWNHSKAFTLGNFPEPIQIGEKNKAIALENCQGCHGQLVGDMHISRSPEAKDAPTCTTCHGNVGHQGNK